MARLHLLIVATLCLWSAATAFIIASCDFRSCEPPSSCVNGVCTVPSCAAVLCEVGNKCVDGRCIPNDLPSCAAVTCSIGSECVDGRCIPSDSPSSSCDAVPCKFGFVCIDGRCRRNFNCFRGKCDPPPPKCSIERCSRTGRSAQCTLFRIPMTCATWARTFRPNCAFACPLNCISGPYAPRDNEGSTYCNECLLRSASCKSGFTNFGPVESTVGMATPIANPTPFGGLPPGPPPGECSTVAVLVTPPQLCPEGETCVLFDLGFIAADRPNSGNCQVVEGDVPPCSSSVCSKPDTLCSIRNDVTTCEVFDAQR